MNVSEKQDIWASVKSNYMTWVFLIGIGVFGVYSYFAASTIAGLTSIIGLLVFWHIRGVRTFAGPVVTSGLLVVLALIRSDFVTALVQGKGWTAALAGSDYMLPLVLMWLFSWCLICAAAALDEKSSAVVFRWFFYVMMVFTGVLAIEAVTHWGLSDWLNMHVFGGKRTEMVVVKVSNTNFVLMMMFWPLCFYLMQQKRIAWILFMTVTLIGLGIVVDTDAQGLGILSAYVIFLIAKYWPRSWEVRGVTPERVLAVLAALFTVVFPAMVYAVIRTGTGPWLKAHMQESWADRIDIYSFAVARSVEKPIWGWGYEAARRFYPMIPDHTHNMSLQAWLELGVPGLLILAAFWFLLFWNLAPAGSVRTEIDKQDNGLRELSAPTLALDDNDSLIHRARPYMLAAAWTYFFVNAVSYGIWRSQLYCLGAMMVAMAILAFKAVAAQTRADVVLPLKVGFEPLN